MRSGNFEGVKGHPIIKYRDTLRCGHLCKNGCTDQDAMWVMARMDPRNHVLDGGSDCPMGRGNFKERRAHCKYWDILPWAVWEWLDRSICRLNCGLGWAEGSICSIVFTRLCQCTHMRRHIGATWQILLNCPSVAVMQSYVELLWPFVIMNICKVHWIVNACCHTYNNNNYFTALCPGLSGCAGTRRNTHQPTILIIIQSLSASSIYHDP